MRVIAKRRASKRKVKRAKVREKNSLSRLMTTKMGDRSSVSPRNSSTTQSKRRKRPQKSKPQY